MDFIKGLLEPHYFDVDINLVSVIFIVSIVLICAALFFVFVLNPIFITRPKPKKYLRIDELLNGTPFLTLQHGAEDAFEFVKLNITDDLRNIIEILPKDGVYYVDFSLVYFSASKQVQKIKNYRIKFSRFLQDTVKIKVPNTTNYLAIHVNRINNNGTTDRNLYTVSTESIKTGSFFIGLASALVGISLINIVLCYYAAVAYMHLLQFCIPWGTYLYYFVCILIGGVVGGFSFMFQKDDAIKYLYGGYIND